MGSKYRVNPLENAVWDEVTEFYTYLLSLSGIKAMYDTKTENEVNKMAIFRILCILYTKCKDNVINEVLADLNFDKETICKYQNFKYPQPEKEFIWNALKYHDQNLIQLIILKNDSDSLKKLETFLGEDQFLHVVFQVAESNNLNALEYAIRNNRSFHYYLLTIQGIKDYYNVNNDNDATNNALFRLMYTLFVDNGYGPTIDKVLKTLNISNETV